MAFAKELREHASSVYAMERSRLRPSDVNLSVCSAEGMRVIVVIQHRKHFFPSLRHRDQSEALSTSEPSSAKAPVWRRRRIFGLHAFQGFKNQFAEIPIRNLRLTLAS
jgi:hypothetical protein